MRTHRPKSPRTASLPCVNPHAAGLDIGSEAEWRVTCGIETVAMESTGVYWIPVYELLEARGFQVYLVNAQHVKHVPGRKSDIKDCQ